MTAPEPRRRPRREKIAIGFMILWVVFWTACMFIVIYGLVMALWARDMGPVAFMLFWLAAASFGLSKGLAVLRQLLTEGLPQAAPARSHDWNDGTDGGDDRPER